MGFTGLSKYLHGQSQLQRGNERDTRVQCIKCHRDSKFTIWRVPFEVCRMVHTSNIERYSNATDMQSIGNKLVIHFESKMVTSTSKETCHCMLVWADNCTRKYQNLTTAFLQYKQVFGKLRWEGTCMTLFWGGGVTWLTCTSSASYKSNNLFSKWSFPKYLTVPSHPYMQNLYFSNIRTELE